MELQSSPELKTCLDGHKIAVIDNDEYRVKELYENDKDVKYIIDLGANLGTASYMFQKYFPEAKILVCEPEPELMKYAKLNTEGKLTYIEKAIIGDDRKEVKFNICKWAGNHHVDGTFRWDLFAPMGSEKVGEIIVKATTLKKLITLYKFPRIDLLKIDTEGMEGQILQAFKPYMKMVKHILGEWHGDKDRDLIEDALKETHNVIFNKQLTTHGDIFAEPKGIEIKKDIYAPPVPNNTDFNPASKGFRIIKREGMPDKKQWLL